MKQILPNTINQENVGLFFYNHNRNAIEDVRLLLFSNLEKYHPSISIAVRRILAERLKTSHSPLLAEMYPHILNDLLPGINQRELKNVSAQWLAGYVLTILVDNNCDMQESINGKLIPPLHLETSKLYRRIAGTKYSELFEELVFDSIKGQIVDTQLQKKGGHWNAKIRTARQKNKILSAFSTVIASLMYEKSQADFSMNLSDNLLLSYQLLDDIADFESDYTEGNNTALLCKINTDHRLGVRRQLLNEVILSGTMQSMVRIILKTLKRNMVMLDDYHFVNKKGNAFNYFRRLLDEIEVLGKLLEQYQGQPRLRLALGNSIDRQIRIVCHST